LHKQNFYYPYWNLSTRYQVQNCVILANNWTEYIVNNIFYTNTNGNYSS
jgi:hypothetical protein